MRWSWCAILAAGSSLAVLASACDDSPTQPTVTSMNVVLQAPPPGTAINLPADYVFFNPGGLTIPRGSGFISVRVDLTVAQPEPVAQLTVLLMSGNSGARCGENAPDRPVWESIDGGGGTTVTITRVGIYSLPCLVTGIRAVLGRRTGFIGASPPPGEIIVETTIPVDFTLIQ
jgi:hypothetical protein